MELPKQFSSRGGIGEIIVRRAVFPRKLNVSPKFTPLRRMLAQNSSIRGTERICTSFPSNVACAVTL